MSFWRFCWLLVKMFYQLILGTLTILSILFNIFWFACNFASCCIPWFTLLFIGVCVVSKFVKLKSPNEKNLIRLLGASGSIEDLSYWPIANRAAGYDAPENSKAAVRKCAARGYHSVLLDAGLSCCGQIVVLHKKTLEQAGLRGGIAKYTFEELRKINITEQHPMGSQFESEYAYTLTDLMQLLETNRLTVFLNISDSSALMLEKLKTFIRNNSQFSRRTIIVSRSPYAIYQLRKTHPDLMCGLWTEKSLSLTWIKASTLITSVCGAIFRNIIAPVIGISVVFLSKEEFNLHIAELWRNVGVRPIVYTVNSPNEKRYFQKTMKTQYLTDSLRSEPHLLMKA